MWGLVVHAAIPRRLREAEQGRVGEARRPAWAAKRMSATVRNWGFSSRGGGELGLKGEGRGLSQKGPSLS